MILTLAALTLTVQTVKPKLLVVEGLIIAHQVSGRWKTIPEAYQPPFKRMAFKEVRVGSLGPTTMCRDAGYEEVTGGSYVVFPSPEESSVQTPGPAGGAMVSNLKPTFPRPVRTFSAASATYQRIADDFNRSKGLKVKAKVNRVISCDLDGDGGAEVIIEGGNCKGRYDNPPGKLRYSWILLRYISGGQVRQRTLEFNKTTDEVGVAFYALQAVADLDGDRRMEIVTSGEYWESNDGVLYDFNRGRLTVLARKGAGV